MPQQHGAHTTPGIISHTFPRTVPRIFPGTETSRELAPILK